MGALTRQKKHTYNEFCQLVEDGQKADLIDGEIYMASPDNTDALDIQGWLDGILEFYVRILKLGRLFASRAAFYLSECDAPEPDIAFVRKSRLHLVNRGRIDGRPDAAFEIVSPSSIEHDYVTKRDLYQEYGVPEYWLIDEVEQKVTLLRLDANGKYKVVKPRKGILRSRVIKGFWLKIDWSWQRPLPDPQETLNEIMGKTK